jgi:hypothetical protein
MINTVRKPLAAALMLGLGAASAHAQVELSNALDGHWWNPAEGGRGALVDFIANEGNAAEGTMFMALYTFDQTGAPIWLTVQKNGVASHENAILDAMLVRTTGGRFGDSHDAGATTTSVVGSADILVNSCDSISIEITPDAGTNLPAATYDLERFPGNVGDCGEAPVVQCPAGTTDLGSNACGLPSTVAGNLRLPRGKTYIVEGQVTVPAGATLTVDPGVTVQGSATAKDSPNFIAVLADGKIIANGTREQPITFTGPEPVPGSWAGLVIAGRSTCNDAPDAELGCSFEAIPDVVYGGQDLDDNSGSLRYVRILWAGQAINEDEELNSLTLCGVGSGTTLEYVQVHGGLDDGFEMFGGTVNGRHLVATQVGDDMFDFDDGYTGKIQFALGLQGSENSDQGSDSNGIESDNSRDNPGLAPRTAPVIANMTLIGSPNGNEGARIRRGSGGHYSNLVIHGFANSCLNIDDDATAALYGNDLTIDHSFVGTCGTGAFEDDAVVTSTLWNGGTGNATGDAMLDGWMPRAGSPLLGTGATPDDGFFTEVDYKGAFDGSNDWTAGWIYTPGAQ